MNIFYKTLLYPYLQSAYKIVLCIQNPIKFLSFRVIINQSRQLSYTYVIDKVLLIIIY